MSGRILGIDYGSKKTGLAVTDPLEIIVSPLDTVPTIQLVEYIVKYLSVEKVYKVVIGDPSPSLPKGHPNLLSIKKLENTLLNKFPDLEIDYQDETLSSQRARQIILQSGAKRKKRRDKSLVDKISAVLILQDYLGHY